MKYWYDTEFIEDGKTIDLLSIGIVAEDGRTLYLENADADLSKASDWVRENVLPTLRQYGFDGVCSKTAIAAAVKEFCDVEKYGKPEFWGYYSAYDHVALCQLFGTMMDLPKGWPMYTRDLRQWADSLGITEPLDKFVSESAAHHALADARWTKVAWQFLKERVPQSLTLGQTA